MVTIKILVNGADISAVASGGLTVGMTGVTYEVEYDPSWDGLSKIIIFRAGLNQMAALDGLVPSGVLTAERKMLRVGVEGRNRDGGLVIPTIWADVDYVLPSASTDGASNLDPANPVWAQSAAIAQQALDKAEQLEQRADSGEFQGEPGPQGPGYTHSEEFASLANQVRTDTVTAENAAKLAGQNASHAASASKEAKQSAIAAQAEANRAKQEADRASQGSGGLTAQQEELMLTILRSGVYSSDQSNNIDQLAASFTDSGAPDPPAPVETCPVTNTLTHCTSSNGAAAVAKGQPYNAVLTADQGYTMEGADITVLMGGDDITVQTYSFGTIRIEAVTGNLVITAAAVEAGGEPPRPKMWTVTNSLTGCVSSNSIPQVTDGSSYSAVLKASAGYTMNGAAVTVTMGGTEITDTAYKAGRITISAVTGNVVITAAAAGEGASPILPEAGLQAYFDCVGSGETVTEFSPACGENMTVRMKSNSGSYIKEKHGAQSPGGPYAFLKVVNNVYGPAWSIAVHCYSKEERALFKPVEYIGDISATDAHGGRSIGLVAQYLDGDGQNKSGPWKYIHFTASERKYKVLVLTVNDEKATLYFDGVGSNEVSVSELPGFKAWYTDFTLRYEKGRPESLLSHLALYSRALSAEEAQSVIDYMRTQEVAE